MPDHTQPRKTNDSIIARLRMDRGLTQEGLAEAAELSVPYVSHIERRKRKPAFQPLSGLPLHWGSRWIPYCWCGSLMRRLRSILM